MTKSQFPMTNPGPSLVIGHWNLVIVAEGNPWRANCIAEARPGEFDPIRRFTPAPRTCGPDCGWMDPAPQRNECNSL